MFLITLRDIALVGVDTAGLSISGLLPSTLGGSLLLRMAMSACRTLICCYLLEAVAGDLPYMELARSVAAITLVLFPKWMVLSSLSGTFFPWHC